MPNNNRITANLLLRYATYGQWMVSEVILQPGEAAVAAFPNIDPSQPPQAVGIKIGDGRAYVQDLPFIDGALRQELLGHINDPDIHVTIQEKLFWNNKLNVNDHMELVNGALILNRN